MSMSSKTCCVPGCMGSGNTHSTLHLFPNPAKDKQRFNTWVYTIGGDIIGLDDEDIYKRRRVCHSHFEEKYCCRLNRISNIAVPTINLPDKGTIPMECKDTADLLLFFDKLFDAHNGSYTKKQAKPLLGPERPNSCHHALWKESKNVLNTMKFVNSTSGRVEIVPTINNWVWTLDGTQLLFKKFEKEYGITSVWTRHLKDNGHLTQQQCNFNFCLSSARMSIERGFGMWKSRWRSILDCLPMVNIEKIPEYLLATAVLHNICIQKGDMIPIEPQLRLTRRGPLIIGGRENGIQKRQVIMNSLIIRNN